MTNLTADYKAKVKTVIKKGKKYKNRRTTRIVVKVIKFLLVFISIVAAIYFGGLYVKTNISKITAIKAVPQWYTDGIAYWQSLFNGTGVASSAPVITSSADCLNITITDSGSQKHISPALKIGNCYNIGNVDQAWWNSTFANSANVTALVGQITGDKTGIDVPAAITASLTTHILDLR